MHTKLAASVALLALGFGSALAGTAQAQTVNATLAAQYYEVPHDIDPDFSGGYPTVAAGSHLGIDGLPVGTGVSDVTADGEITWWSPALNSNVKYTGAGTISLPYSSNTYAPGSTGTDDYTFFETAVYKGSFTLASSSTVTFDLGSDDDSFIYVDGSLFGQNPGIHANSDIAFTTPTLGAGPHSLEVFYADRESSGADLSLSLDANSSGVIITPPAPPVSGAPEPGTWALMLGGLGLLGGVLRVAQARRREEEVAA